MPHKIKGRFCAHTGLPPAGAARENRKKSVDAACELRTMDTVPQIPSTPSIHNRAKLYAVRPPGRRRFLFAATSPGTRLARSRTETKLPLVTASTVWRKLSVASLYLARPVQHIRGQPEYNTFSGHQKKFGGPLPVIFTKARFIAVFVKYKREAPPKCNNLRQLPASSGRAG